MNSLLIRLNGFWARALLAVTIGVGIGLALATALAMGLSYVAPTQTEQGDTGMLKPFVDGRWVKAPFNIVRSRECLAQSTITLRRWHDYPEPLGRREDVVPLGLYNTSTTDVGSTNVVLWFPIPDGLDSGSWSYVGKTQDDCGGWLDFAARHPRTVYAGDIILPERAP